MSQHENGQVPPGYKKKENRQKKEKIFLWAAGNYKKTRSQLPGNSKKGKTVSIEQWPSPSEGSLKEGVQSTTLETSEKDKDLMTLNLPFLVRQEFERVVGSEVRNGDLGACYREGRDG